MNRPEVTVIRKSNKFRPSQPPEWYLKQQEEREQARLKEEEEHEASLIRRKPMVAIVGRPNVGKSSLFNRLIGHSKSLVTPIAGTTRDRVYGTVEWEGWEFITIDTGGLMGDSDVWSSDIHEQAMVAIEEADVLIVVTDIRRDEPKKFDPKDPEASSAAPAELVDQKEKALAKMFRLKNKPVLIVANKCDNMQMVEKAKAFERLGLGEVIPVSAIHGTGEVDLLEALAEKFTELKFAKPIQAEVEEEKETDEAPETPESSETVSDDAKGVEEKEAVEDDYDREIRIAIVGKPNVGKSSFMNRLIGSERSVVSDIPGTTADPVDERLTWRKGNKIYNVVLVDTAGLRKKKHQLVDSIEHLSALWALKVIDRCDVSLLLVDTSQGIEKQDIHIAEFVAENFKSSIIVFNKWDLAMEHEDVKQKEFVEAARQHLPNIDYSPVMFCSAKSGFQISKVIDRAIEVVLNRRRKLPSSSLMKVLQTTTLMRAPPGSDKKRLRFKFATQADSGVPTITFFVNDPDLRHEQYDRYLENRFREEFPSLEGSPLRFMYRKNTGKEKLTVTPSGLKKTPPKKKLTIEERAERDRLDHLRRKQKSFMKFKVDRNRAENVTDRSFTKDGRPAFSKRDLRKSMDYSRRSEEL